MAASPRPSGNRALQALISLAVAAVLVGAATLVRLVLNGALGALSPFMLYVAAVLAAGLARGPFCGVLVMAAGGAIGWRLFLSPGGVIHPGAAPALLTFWAVSSLVLVTANELRVQLKVAMDRLASALERSGRRP